MPDNYLALALQTRCDAINSLDNTSARQAMLATINRIHQQIAACRAFIGTDAQLFVLPEYFLTGFPMGDTIEGWAEKAGISAAGPEYDALGKVSQDNAVFLAGNAYELDSHFPGLYFQTSFIIDPSGNVILRYRRLISMFAPTPHDVWDQYLDIYGIDSVFPVADTAIGKLAACASEEILYPEITRAHALRGAEVILHSTSEIGSTELTPKDIAKRARAIENLVYVVSANSAGIAGTAIPSASTDGMSKVLDYKGRILASAGFGETMVANAEIDLNALRGYRRRPGMANMLARQRLELFSQSYSGHSIYPANSLLDETGAKHIIPQRGHFVDTQRKVIETLHKKHVI